MKVKSVLLSVGLLLGGGLTLAGVASGLGYQDKVELKFNFEPALGVSLSNSTIRIKDLAPGTSASSNVISINVNTNNITGYVLSATIGNGTTYEDNALTNTLAVVPEGSDQPTFTSIPVSSTPVASLTSDNTWAYTLDSTNYYGLAYKYSTCSEGETCETETWTVLNATKDVSGTAADSGCVGTCTGTNATNFSISARAATTQATGDYSNIIQFSVVSNRAPLTLSDSYAAANKTKYNGYYKIQDMTTDICSATEVLDNGSQMQVIDVRDNKLYWITKLKDGHCWMTQNLDFNIPTTALTSETTDLTDHSLAGAYATGYSYDENTGITTWIPERATINAVTTSADDDTITTISGWSGVYADPYSADPGDWYWRSQPYYYSSNGCPSTDSTNPTYIGCNYMSKMTQDNNGTTVNNQWETYFSTTPFTANSSHGHVGNYYNWTAAIASNNSAVYDTSTLADVSNNPQNSICPANWRLPTITTASPNYTNDGSLDEFSRLAKLYANYSGSTSLSSANLEASPLYLVRAGDIWGSTLHSAGDLGRYWSSTVSSSSQSYNLYFYSTSVSPQYVSNRSLGNSLRCLAR